MEIWLDTINTDLMKQAEQLGILTGVTTNPAILDQSNSDKEIVLDEILRAQSGPVTAQVTAQDCEGMIEQAHQFLKISKRFIIKIPVTKEGLQAIHLLSRKSIRTMATVIFHPNQALLAAKAGADYVAPYLGRIDESGEDGIEVLYSILMMFENYKFETKLLAASIKTKEQIKLCAELGVHAITLKDAIFNEFIENNILTMQILQKFALAAVK